ncbi:MAG: hypothetical protein F6J97_23010 [Leptolyngbya sp. SIO4C1]|nr:hypothetical protein [Leptolyngbya sp. SIO4C1]
MRALFYEALLDACRQANLGIAQDCLGLITDKINQVVETHHAELLDRDTFVRTYADFQEFVRRMIQSAQDSNFDALHEPTFFDALGQCGLVFWCQ